MFQRQVNFPYRDVNNWPPTCTSTKHTAQSNSSMELLLQVPSARWACGPAEVRGQRVRAEQTSNSSLVSKIFLKLAKCVILDGQQLPIQSLSRQQDKCYLSWRRKAEPDGVETTRQCLPQSRTWCVHLPPKKTPNQTETQDFHCRSIIQHQQKNTSSVNILLLWSSVKLHIQWV